MSFLLEVIKFDAISRIFATFIVCAELRYPVDFSEYTIPSDLNPTSALNNCILKIGEKEIKVSSD
jgi:hypothetical protein